MIRVEDVRKIYRTRFGEKLVLDGINFELGMGERLGILGRNGAGKSTLVRLVSGAEKPTSGRVERHMCVSWPLAFGGAFQPMLTGLDNLRFISRIYGQDFRRNLEFVEDFAELGPYIREPVRTYSSGMRARLAFAISMIIEFDCFLIDEIASVGDARFHARCNFELFERRADRSMIIISHDATYVRDHCSRFAVLHAGKLTEYESFDVAYDMFKQSIGVGQQQLTSGLTVENVARSRLDLIELSQQRARADDRFSALVREGDWLRDKAELSLDAADQLQAERSYLAALALYPYERTIWVPLGHAAKEQGAFERAESAYRTACALGQPAQEVIAHLEFVMQHLGLSGQRFPIRSFKRAEPPEQIPGIPDVKGLAWLLWVGIDLSESDTLELLRTSVDMDALLVRMINDPRFFLACEGNISAESGSARKNAEWAERDCLWIDRVICTLLPELALSERQELRQNWGGNERILRMFCDSELNGDWSNSKPLLRKMIYSTQNTGNQ